MCYTEIMEGINSAYPTIIGMRLLQLVCYVLLVGDATNNVSNDFTPNAPTRTKNIPPDYSFNTPGYGLLVRHKIALSQNIRNKPIRIMAMRIHSPYWTISGYIHKSYIFITSLS